MENDRPGKKLAKIFVIVVLLILIFTGKIKISDKEIDIKSLLNINGSTQELVDSMTIEDNSINTINIRTVSTDIEIKESLDDIKLEYYSNRENNPKIRKEDNIILLDEGNFDENCFGICNINRTLVLYIPSNFDGKLNILTTSGDVKSTTNIENETDIITTSGDISLLDTNDIYVETTSGDVKIETVNNRVIFKSVSGDILIKKLNIKENSTITTTSGDVKVKNNISNCYVSESTTSGDVRIKKSNRKSNIELKIKTTSGDIIVN